jgi:hypothetical protein
MREVDVDGGDQLGDAGKAAFAHDLVGQLAKEALYEVEPRGAGGGEVNVKARVLLEPGANHGVFVSRVVVDDQMQGQFSRCLAVQLFQKGQPLDVRMVLGGRAHPKRVSQSRRYRPLPCPCEGQRSSRPFARSRSQGRNVLT